MDSVKHEEVTIIDKDDTSNTVCHVVDGFLLEESNEPFPVSIIFIGNKRFHFCNCAPYMCACVNVFKVLPNVKCYIR